MKVNRQPDMSVLVSSIQKRGKGFMDKNVSVYLDKDVDIELDTSAFEIVDTLPPASEAKESTFYITPDNSLNYVDNGVWKSISGGGSGGAIISNVAPSRSTQAEIGQTYFDTTTGKYYILRSIDSGSYLWSEIEKDNSEGNTKYAGLTYYTVWEETCEMTWGEGCTLDNVDIDLYNAWCDAHPYSMGMMGRGRDFNYQSEMDAWQTFADEGPIVIPAEDMVSTTGLTLTLTGGDWAYASIEKSVDVDKTSELATVDILGVAQWDRLGNDGDKTANLVGLGADEISIAKAAVYKIEIENTTPGYYPDNFLRNCANLVYIQTTGMLGNNLEMSGTTRVGEYFLSGCISLNSETPNSEFRIINLRRYDGEICKIGAHFMSSMYDYQTETGFNASNINIYGMAIASDYFFSGNPSFQGTATVEGIIPGKSFMQSAGMSTLTFNVSESDAGNYFTELPEGFCSNCSRLTNIYGTNQTKPWELKTVTKIGNMFCHSCSLLQQSYGMNFPTLAAIGEQFLAGCSSFVGLLSLPSVSVIGTSFMQGCTSFNQKISFPSLVSLDSGFMNGCSAFEQDLSFPVLVKHNLGMFLYNSKVMSVNFGSEDYSAPYASYDAKYVLATDDSSSVLYLRGVKITGPKSTTFCNQYATSTSSPYRVLINKGTGKGITIGNTRPTSQTAGEKGDLYTYVDTSTDTPHLYMCVTALPGAAPGNYTWVEIGGE